MSKLSGAVLVIAGVAVGAYTLSPRHQSGAEIATPQPGDGAKAAAVRSTGDPPNGPGAAHPAEPPAPRRAVTAGPPAPPVKTAGAQSPAAKVVAPQAVHIAEAPPRVPVDQHKSADAPPPDGAELTREIQRELKRIGCYHGPISGVWSPAVRQAMRTFTDRVNATLPIERPDPILLAMVQGHRQAACGASCRAGESLAANGRCLPSALVARAGKDQAPARQPPPGPPPAKAAGDGDPATTAAAVAVAPVTPANPADERMSLAGPPPSARRPAQVKAPTSTPPRKHTVQHAKSMRPPRYADTRARRRDTREYYGPTPGPVSGFPWWAIRAFAQ